MQLQEHPISIRDLRDSRSHIQTDCGTHWECIWQALGILLGGCPLRQLILAGEGNTDSAVTVLGLMAGAAFAHNFGLASSGEGPTANGKIAVIIGIVVVAVIAAVNSMRKEEA